ncbi:MAG: two-component system cell cycle sensor histidine kinase/response regulator CckA [Cognaticolwellia sp.]|jgi:two-component system cell cycle sensor histidine kinase/response regulator CckA
MSEGSWDIARKASAHALGFGMWRLDLKCDTASWDAVGAMLLNRTGPESAQAFVVWLQAGAGDEVLPQWREDEEWVSAPVTFRSPDGPRYVRLAGRRDGLVWEGSVQDITRERMLTQRVAQAERMEAIGQFSAGVAHNFNNMLTIIVACLADADARISRQDSPDQEITRDIHDAQEAARRATVVVANLSRLTQADGEQSEICQIQPLCAGAIEGLRRVAVEGLEIVHSIPPGLLVRQAPGVLEQVLSNLLVNANYAVQSSEHPTVWLRGSRNETFDVPTLELIVSDNGTGVPPEVEPHLFQPFVTTKEREGTGLGLATASESLRRMGGQLAYRPRDGGGAEFVIVLPLVPLPANLHRLKPSKHPRRAPTRELTGRRVLVVDDEPIILRLVRRILEQHGATVTTVGDLASAQEALTPAHDVVLLDQTLGRERGLDLLPALRAAAPDMRVLFFSGEPVSPEVMSLIDGMVAKPVGVEALVDAVSRALDNE